MVHYIKVLQETYEAVSNRVGSFAIRCGDRNYEKGDLLVMQVVNEHGNCTGRSLVCRIMGSAPDVDVQCVEPSLSVLCVGKDPITTLEVWPETGEQYFAAYDGNGEDICDNHCRHPEDKTAEHCRDCFLQQLITKLGNLEYHMNLPLLDEEDADDE